MYMHTYIYICMFGDYVGIMKEKRKLLFRISGSGLGLYRASCLFPCKATRV